MCCKGLPHGHASSCPWAVSSLPYHGRVRLRRPGAKGFEDAERGLWRMRLPPGDALSARDLEPSRDPNPASSGPDAAAPCLKDCGADSAPARAAAQGGRAGAGNPGVDPARVPGFNDMAAQEGEVVGYWRAHSTLTHVVIRNAGHMVPHDRPLVAQARTCLLCHHSVPCQELLLLLTEGLLVHHSSMRSSRLGSTGLAHSEGSHRHEVVSELGDKPLPCVISSPYAACACNLPWCS